MKKLLLSLICLLGISTATAQSDKTYVYGVDFTQAKVFAATETIEDFVQAFEGINMLLLTESDKYALSEMLGFHYSTVLDPIMSINSNHDYSNLKIYNKENIAPIDYASLVKSYKLPQTEGTGVIIVAKLLDKPAAHASYCVVLFDIATRNIITTQNAIGKAGGFGLRNYWARTLYNIIWRTTIKK